MLAEILIAVIGISLMSLMAPPISFTPDTAAYTFADGYLLAQSEAILYGERNEYVSEDGQTVSFNPNGNVAYPRTLHFRSKDIVVELGGGRLVEK